MEIRTTVLPNGLRVITDHMPQVETVSLGIWIGAGSRYETQEVNGVAHLVEHMLFKGTPTRTAFDISQQIEAVGGHLNAYTGREQTAYHMKILKKDVALAVDILADMLQNSLLDEQELARERTVVLQEIGQSQDTPDDIIFDQAQEVAFGQQILGLPILGTTDIISKMPRESLVSYIKNHYTTSRMVLVGAGNIDHDAFVALAAKAFTKLPNAPASAPVTATYKGGESRTEKQLEQVHIIMGFKGVDYFDPNYYAQSILSVLLGGGMSSRLFQEVREKRGLVYSIHTFAAAYRDTGFFGVYAGTGPQHVPELIPVMCDEIAKVADDVKEAEVESARTQLRSNLLMGLESTMARAEHVAQKTLIFGKPMLPEELLKKLEAVTLQDVRQAALNLRKQPLTLASLGPVQNLESYDKVQKRFL